MLENKKTRFQKNGGGEIYGQKDYLRIAKHKE